MYQWAMLGSLMLMELKTCAREVYWSLGWGIGNHCQGDRWWSHLSSEESMQLLWRGEIGSPLILLVCVGQKLNVGRSLHVEWWVASDRVPAAYRDSHPPAALRPAVGEGYQTSPPPIFWLPAAKFWPSLLPWFMLPLLPPRLWRPPLRLSCHHGYFSCLSPDLIGLHWEQ